MDLLTFIDCHKMYLTYYSVYSRTLECFYFKERREEVEVQEFFGSLKILAIVPLHYCILELADSVGVAKYFKNTILNVSLFTVITIG